MGTNINSLTYEIKYLAQYTNQPFLSCKHSTDTTIQRWLVKGCIAIAIQQRNIICNNKGHNTGYKPFRPVFPCAVAPFKDTIFTATHANLF